MDILLLVDPVPLALLLLSMESTLAIASSHADLTRGVDNTVSASEQSADRDLLEKCF